MGQELMVIGRSCMKVELRSSEQKCLKHPGRKSLQNGARGQRQDCQSGSVSVQAKKLETQRHLRVKKMLVLKLKKPRRSMMKRKKRRRRRKKFLTYMWQTSTSHRRNYKHSIRVIASIPSRALVSWFSPFCCYCYRRDQTGQ